MNSTENKSVMHGDDRVSPMHNKKKGFNARRKKELIFYWAVLAFPLFQFVLMYICVNINSFILAFKDYTINADFSTTVTFVGFKHFKTFLNSIIENELMLGMFTNSMILFIATIFFGTVLTLFFSYYIYKKFWGTEFFRVMLILPSVISSVALVLIFMYVLDYVLPAMGLPMLLSGNPQRQYITIVAFNIFIGFGTGVLMYSNAMSKISESIVESCRLEGCSAIREFVSITLPLIYPTVETFLIINISNIFINQANLVAFFGPSAQQSVQTIGYYLFVKVFDSRTTMSEFPYASAAGLTLTAVTIPVVMFFKWLLHKFDPEVEF